MFGVPNDQLVKMSGIPNDDVSSIFDNESNRMYFQAPSASENNAFKLMITTFCSSTPTKTTVDCGVPFPFFWTLKLTQCPIPWWYLLNQPPEQLLIFVFPIAQHFCNQSPGRVAIGSNKSTAPTQPASGNEDCF
jgi:hypothetical protein